MFKRCNVIHSCVQVFADKSINKVIAQQCQLNQCEYVEINRLNSIAQRGNVFNESNPSNGWLLKKRLKKRKKLNILRFHLNEKFINKLIPSTLFLHFLFSPFEPERSFKILGWNAKFTPEKQIEFDGTLVKQHGGYKSVLCYYFQGGQRWIINLMVE